MVLINLSFDGMFLTPSFDGMFLTPSFDGMFLTPSFDGGGGGSNLSHPPIYICYYCYFRRKK